MPNQGVLAASSKGTQNVTPNTNNYDNQIATNQAISKDIYLVRNHGETLKSIAEKLGFFNFDEDEFDTPSFMKKNERSHDSQI
jgi:hypothetical protein